MPATARIRVSVVGLPALANLVCYSLDCVATLFAALRTRNYRIRLNGVLNRCCALVHNLESILRAQALKIVLQHNPLGSRHRADASALRLRVNTGHLVLFDHLIHAREQTPLPRASDRAKRKRAPGARRPARPDAHTKRKSAV